MKKFTLLLFVFTLGLILVGCNKDYKPPKSDVVGIQEVSNDFKGNTYTYVYEVENSLEDTIQSIGYTTATTIYNSLKEEIGIKTMYLNLTFKIDGKDKLILNYQINKNVNNLGLTLLKETIK